MRQVTLFLFLFLLVISCNHSASTGVSAVSDGDRIGSVPDTLLPDADTLLKPADSDSDGIPDSVEGVADTDHDTIPDYLDTDSDNDGISDTEEAGSEPTNPRDTDTDGKPDYIDEDSDEDGASDASEIAEGTDPLNKENENTGWLTGDADGDGIPNGVEGRKDKDGDGIPNYLDLDSDGDNILDSIEAGDDPLHPRMSDSDPRPDFLDNDSDNDRLGDRDEVLRGTNPTLKDTDGDGSDDLAEIVYESNNPGGADPLDYYRAIPEGIFYLVLARNFEEDTERTLTFNTYIEAVDVAILVDLSGSMQQEITNLKQEIKTNIIEKLRDTLPIDMTFSLAWTKWEEPPYGLVEFQTHEADTVAESVLALGDADGSDEYLPPAIFLLATGAEMHGLAEPCIPGMGGCNASPDWVKDIVYDIPKVDCTGKEGSVGGACFREKAMPVFIVLTDEEMKECPLKGKENQDSLCRWSGSEPKGISEAIAVMNGIGAKFIGVDSGFECEANLENCKKTEEVLEDFIRFAHETHSLDADGNPFIYHTDNPDGSGLSAQLSEAVTALTTYIDMDVTTGTLPGDPCNGINAANFVKASAAVSAEPEEGIAGKDEKKFFSVRQGTKLTFNLKFRNDFCSNEDHLPRVYRAHVSVLGNGSYLSSRLINVIVPCDGLE